MLMITEGLELSYLSVEEKIDFDALLNKKVFRVASTPLSYRQVNSLDSDKLLPEDNKREKGWRKFSIKEIVYLELIKELKAFGLKHEQLKELWKSFFEEYGKGGRNKHIGEMAISCTLGGVEITLTIDKDGEVIFWDPVNYVFFGDSNSRIQIQLNGIVKKVWEMAGKREIPITHTLRDEYLYKNKEDIQLTTREEKLIKIIRDKSYTAIRMRKKDGDIETVYAEQIKDKNESTKRDILKTLKNKDFQDISLIQRDGKIVNFKVEETIKLS